MRTCFRPVECFKCCSRRALSPAFLSSIGPQGSVNRRARGRGRRRCRDRGSGAHGGASGAAHGGEAGTGAGAAGEAAGGGSSAAGEGGAGESSAGASGAPGDTTPDIDAGIGCVAPADEALPSAASEGLPASGLALWLRADRGVYLTSADRVCAWADQSGHDALFVPAGDSTRPLWVAGSVGAGPAVHFDAVGRYLAVVGVLGIAPTSARTLITVVKLVSTTARCSALQQGQGGSPGTYIMTDANTFLTAGSREGVYVMNNAYDAALATSTAARIHLFTLGTMTPGNAITAAVDYRVNGAAQTLTRTSGGLGNGNFEDFSGANYTLVGGCPDAFVAEALLYDRALSTTERGAVEAALETRYGIQ
jgi:hypothetical protein